jgi:uncharacterized protein YwgA
MRCEQISKKVRDRAKEDQVTKRDWTLMAIASAEGQPLSPVQLQKSLFLLSRNVKTGKDFYTFSPYNYGPFCQQIYSDAEDLAAQGFVEMRRRPGESWFEYSITKAGMEKALALEQKADPAASAYLDKAVAWARSLSFADLVRSIYKHFPEFRKNSVFQG